MSEETKVNESSTPSPKRPNYVLIGMIAVLAVAAAYKGYGMYTYASSHVDTDDAYVTGDLVNIGPTVSGTLMELDVRDGQFVHKGDPIAKLDTSGPEADLAQAEANLKATETQVPQAEAAYEYARLSTDAAIRSSQAAIAAQSARTAGSQLQVGLTRDTVTQQIRQAESQLRASEAQTAQATAGVATAEAAAASAEQAVVTAQRQAEAAKAATTAARAGATRARKDRDRYARLVASEAITRQQFDSAVAASTAADAQLSGAEQQAEAASSQVDQARRGLQQARAQVVVAMKQADAAKSQVKVAEAALGLAKSGRTNVEISGSNERSSEGLSAEADAGLSSAQAGEQQVALRQKQIATTRAQVDQARAARDQAKVRLRYCFLFAPCDGYVVKRMVNVGTAINPGQTIVTITRGAEVWVVANFKETQIGTIREGQPVDFDVDAFPGQVFHGKVLEIMRATGSATTLIPPDNSTGNFTKVVQRVPIKLSIEPDRAGSASVLRQGMSVSASIETGSNGGSK